MKTKSVSFGAIEVGATSFHVWAGPCVIEDESQFLKSAQFVRSQGGTALRAGIFKLRTSAESFQGLREESQPIIKKVRSETDLLMISEITDPRQIEFLDSLVDIYQVGTRNMFNYELLKELGKSVKPILLKRAFSARIAEWLKAADYIVQGGNENIILCERGIRTFETKTRNTLDLNAVAFLKQESPFPVFVDPSHGTGLSQLVPALSQSAVCAGADGLLIETHPNPSQALCDSQQALSFSEFEGLMAKLKKLTPLYGKSL
ncbi:MAG: 3-deoxy-7-phosphoheptulonate synthase [Oligoflexia bacterium]|nr:3-deoxy-7-phosphoheptulonate synthase [Oligoflexia bacterium]